MCLGTSARSWALACLWNVGHERLGRWEAQGLHPAWIRRGWFDISGGDWTPHLDSADRCLRLWIHVRHALMNASSQAIWQAKVAPDVQGRVFAIRRMIAWSSGLIAPLLAAPLADYVFKPGMAEGGALAVLLGPIVGVGANHGVGVLISVLGLFSVGVCVLSFFSRSIRNVETDLPDHATVPVTEANIQSAD